MLKRILGLHSKKRKKKKNKKERKSEMTEGEKRTSVILSE
jgi:hypothetical protein